MAEYWLQVSEPGHPKRVVTVTTRMEVGRDCNGLLLEDPTVSRRHLTLEPMPAGLVLVDLGSANGTLVDGRRVEGPVVLHAGSVILLGETELVVYSGHATTASSSEGEALAVDPHDRVSEQLRNLRSP